MNVYCTLSCVPSLSSYLPRWRDQACWRINTIWGTSGNLPERNMGNCLWQLLGCWWC